MKNFASIFIILIISSIALASASIIIPGYLPGEIYFVSGHADSYYLIGFYYSDDYGENISLHNIETNPDVTCYGMLLPNNADSSLFALRYLFSRLDYSRDRGYNFLEIGYTSMSYYGSNASGCIDGEIYRRITETTPRYLERSENYGLDFTPCAFNGVNGDFSLYTAALGVNPGEVYVYGQPGSLYYSTDYGENFDYLGNPYQTWGISPYCNIYKGTVSGELYMYNYDWQVIYRLTDYGNELEELTNFEYELGWGCDFAPGRQPGELFFIANLTYFAQLGGIAHIHHSLDYGANWTMHEHIFDQNSIFPPTQTIPNDISLSVYPNPANPSFTIEYAIDRTQPVKLVLCNLLGQTVWKYSPGTQNQGTYQIKYAGDNLSNGMYVLNIYGDRTKRPQIINVLK